MYAIVDIETTGISPVRDKITEIAIFIYDGKNIVDEFVSLVNPERAIPANITALTGISNEMVAGAPRFYEIAKKIVRITENKIFVAHNVSFDYRFIRSEFKSLGYHYNRENLCTLQLCRKILPGHPSYSLGKLCRGLNIRIDGRHRAAGDGLATVRLLEILIGRAERKDGCGLIMKSAGINLRNLHPAFKTERLSHVPEKTGVYYFFDEHKELIYIGKSRNMRRRILGHLSNNGSKRAIEMKTEIVDIGYLTTGSELVALLLESDEIRKNKPRYNRSQKRTLFQYGLYSFTDDKGYKNLMVHKLADQPRKKPHTCFTSRKEALGFLNKMVASHWLCQKLCGLYQTTGACFHYSIRQCNGACIGKESPSVYNKRVAMVTGMLEPDQSNCLIIDTGRNEHERSVFRLENGQYRGFGFLETSLSCVRTEDLLDCIQYREDTRDAQQIIHRYLENNQVEKVIYF